MIAILQLHCHWFCSSFFVATPSDRLSPPLDIQLETINCTAFSVRWKMPRRHVSTITGYKVVHFSWISSPFVLIFNDKVSKPLETGYVSCGKKTLPHTCPSLRLCFPPKRLHQIHARPNLKLKRPHTHTQQHTPLKSRLFWHIERFSIWHTDVSYIKFPVFFSYFCLFATAFKVSIMFAVLQSGTSRLDW